MLNTLLNQLADRSISANMASYQIYPARGTAVLFVDAQEAFLTNQKPLIARLRALKQLAHANRFLLIHAQYGGLRGQTYPSRRKDGSPIYCKPPLMAVKS